ncbi:MAG: DUF4293 domain-containing protein [Bacteroides sp.]|nr:DUF4293 domain-containing protein [Bacteroides sp.]
MVIQRWQSVLLLVAAVMMGLFSFMSLGQFQGADVTYNFTALGIMPEGIPTGGAAPEGQSTWYLFVASALSALLALIDIFLFKNYKAQRRMCAYSILLTCVATVLAAWLGYANEFGEISWSSLVCAPFIALIAEIMAYQRIVRDNRIIRDSERLR